MTRTTTPTTLPPQRTITVSEYNDARATAAVNAWRRQQGVR